MRTFRTIFPSPYSGGGGVGAKKNEVCTNCVGLRNFSFFFFFIHWPYQWESAS